MKAVCDDDVVTEASVLEDKDSEASDGEASDDGDDVTSPKRKAPELYSEAEVATMNLRFFVGEEVRCSMGNGRVAAGEIVQHFYREEEWPRGFYAAVRTLFIRTCSLLMDSLTNITCVEFDITCVDFVAHSTKSGCTKRVMTVSS